MSATSCPTQSILLDSNQFAYLNLRCEMHIHDVLHL